MQHTSCVDCDGLGVIKLRPVPTRHDPYPDDEVETLCTCCSGTGFLCLCPQVEERPVSEPTTQVSSGGPYVSSDRYRRLAQMAMKAFKHIEDFTADENDVQYAIHKYAKMCIATLKKEARGVDL